MYPTISGTGPYTDLIQGIAAFNTATAPTLIPQPPALVSASYAFTSGSSTVVTTNNFDPRGVDYSDDGVASLVSVSSNPLSGSVQSLTISGGTALSTGTATSSGGTAVNYGRWQGGTATGVDATGSFTRTIVGSLDWIKGPVQTPFYLGNALTGTAVTYAAAGSTPPTDQNNNTGTINTSTTTLSVNFLKQAVSFNLDATIGANNWIAAATDVKLQDSKAFVAGTNLTDAHSGLTITLNGSGTGTYGVVSGNLYGTGVDAAGLTYALGQGTSNFANGAVAFTGTAQSTSTNYVVGLVSGGMLGSPVNTSGTAIQSTSMAALDPTLAYWVDAGVTAATRVTRDAANQVTKFDLNLPVATSLGCTTACTGTTDTPGTFLVRDATYPLDPPPSPGATTPATALTNTGSDATTGISWGRYVGFVSYTDRIGTTNGVASAAFDARTSNWHGIWASTQNAVPVLPTSGTATYTLLGGTNPTSNTGAVGTLNLGTTTLSADFTNKMVSAAVNLSVGGATWSGSATNMAIQQGTYFEATRNAGVGNLNVTSSIAGVTSGKLSGVFTGNATGTTGGAMLGYALNVGGATGTTVQGVAAFKK